MKTRNIAISTVLIFTLIAAAFISGGCSGQKSNRGTPFSETVSGEETVIWYECQNALPEEEEEDIDIDSLFDDDSKKEEDKPLEFGRETRVIWIKVFSKGKLTTYSCIGNVYLGHFAKMTDEEILKELESDTEKYISGQKDEKYSIYLYTDAAGKEVMYEGIPSRIKLGKKDDPMYFMTLVSREQVAAFQVYDSYYGGYELYNYDETLFGQACMVTRCDNGAKFGLDGLDLEDAVLDYMTPLELLSELNGSIKKDGQSSGNADKEKDSENTNGTDDAAANDKGDVASD